MDTITIAERWMVRKIDILNEEYVAIKLNPIKGTKIRVRRNVGNSLPKI
jgi:hypothetical protein